MREGAETPLFYMQKSLSELTHRYKGKPILVMGGSTCLPSDMEKLKGVNFGCRIGCNHHAAKDYDCDYITCLDIAVNGQPIREFLSEYKKPIISPLEIADYQTPKIPTDFVNTGIMSIWSASLIGGLPIVVAGIELYSNGSGYFNSGQHVKDRNRTDYYQQRCFKVISQLSQRAPVRFVSGCLAERFDKFDTNESFA